MKYYLVTIQYNKVSNAENRPIPKSYDNFNSAQADFYSQVGSDMKNSILGGSLNMVVNEVGGVYNELVNQWGTMHEEETEDVAETEDTETTDAE